MRLVFVGAGYVGLVSGACFAELGMNVTCVDIDAEKIAQLQQGHIPIYEPGLEELVKRNITEGRLNFSVDLTESPATADAVFLAVGTPCVKNSNEVDLSYIFSAAKQVLLYMQNDALLVVKSTVPPGTCQKLTELGANVVSNPEFLREGMAINDFMFPDRIVVGVQNKLAADFMRKLYAKFEAPLLVTSLGTAELIKYSSNAFLAMKITFINEIADICEKVSADVEQVAEGIGLDTRIGKQFLKPGPGFGGSCFPKDISALLDFSETVMAPSKLVNAVMSANNTRLDNCVQKVIVASNNNVKVKRVAVLGIAFKANTDDIRQSPALHLIHGLLNAGAKVVAYDPEAMDNAKQHFAHETNLEFATDINACLQDAEVAVIATEWPEFAQLDADMLHKLMKYPLLVDLRNLYAKDHFIDSGVNYISVGRTADA